MDENFIVLQLIGGVVFGVISAVVASSKGRNAVGWFFCGFFIGLIGLIIIACLPNLNEERNRRNYVDWQQRRVQEQIYQEQVKTQVFQQYTTARLDQHDQHLGLDTRPANQNLGYNTGGNQGYLPGQGQPQVNQQAAAWHVIASNNQRLGPLTSEQIMSLIHEQRLTPSSLAWSQQRNAWCQISEVQELASLFPNQGPSSFPRR